ncbi:WYL domain-containing protein [Schaalia sp. 19OD2882]|uniref:helix-turn-helix transcriptional regulator n=1 Tax=Schaalia sp. 19OD2882 TaxID=2794089 RepID=UPI001C1E8EBF|nr:WYL domain-containing protein [Schaalia sp. 19OD2882]QWW18687.1 WYL domain-containing protein [Schaalia sp. 19OD2882]
MAKDIPTSTRVLELFFELLAHPRGSTRNRVRALRGYATMSEDNFEAHFERDKSHLREAGVLVEVLTTRSGQARYRIAESSFAAPVEALSEQDVRLVSSAIHTWKGSDRTSGLVAPKVLASTDSDAWRSLATPRLELSGAQTVAELADHIRRRNVVCFDYPSSQGVWERSVEPWRIVLRGAALYLWGKDLDRQAPRLFRLDRIRSRVTVIGQPGDAGPVPADLPEPFDNFLLRPLLAIRQGAAVPLDVVDEGDAQAECACALPSGWVLRRGIEAEVGAWMEWILTHGEDVVPIEPLFLREGLVHRLEAASARAEALNA